MLVPAVAASFLLPQTTQATIIGGEVTGGASLTQGGTFINLTVPFTDSNPDNTVGQNTFDTPHLYGFNEDQNITITSEITVNIGTNPVAGDTVASHYIFFDPAGSTSQQGYVDFDSAIYGIATSTATLAASDFLANNNVTYLNPAARGLESGDNVAIDATMNNRLLVDWRASSPGDFIRVFTQLSPAAVPEPHMLALLSIGLMGLSLRRRKSKNSTDS